MPNAEELTRLEGIIERFGGVSVLVVGDLVLDKYTVGRPVRISREAPIAVLEFTREYAVPGGGTSPACTVASLGGRSYLTGVVGRCGPRAADGAYRVRCGHRRRGSRPVPAHDS